MNTPAEVQIRVALDTEDLAQYLEETAAALLKAAQTEAPAALVAYIAGGIHARALAVRGLVKLQPADGVVLQQQQAEGGAL